VRLKGTVAKVVWKEKAIIGEDPLRVFKIFHSSFDF
jgi:hypothetical protein